MMADESRVRYESMLRDCLPHPVRFAEVLDQYADGLLRATEWDAEQWGFSSEKWMRRERVILAHRGGRDWPTEVI